MSKIKLPTAVQLPSGSWRCRVQINGKTYSFVEDTQEEAESKALLARLQKPDTRGERSSLLEQTTISQAIDNYISDRSKVLSPSTIKGYKSMRKYRFQSVMDLPLSANINWQAVVNDESDEVSAKTLKNAWGLLTAVLRSYKLYVPDDITFPQIIRKEHTFLQPDQIKILVQAIEGHRFELAYLLCLHGLRRSEAFAIKKSSIKNGVIRVRGAKVYNQDGEFIEREENKTVESNRDVPVVIPRLSVLAAKCDTEYLCPYKPSSVTHPLNTICRQNELPEVGLHGLRHSFASLCYHLGISEMKCMAYGGWSDITVMRKIYTHLAEADDKSAEEKLKGFFK